MPNEKLITDVVQNQSSFQTRGWSKLAVQVAYDTNVDLAMRLLVEATHGVERVMQDPAPYPYLAAFGADGINLAAPPGCAAEPMAAPVVDAGEVVASP